MSDSLILGIETSCDDTGVAVLQNDRVLSSVVSSQIDVHREWGGVVPQLARREHENVIQIVIAAALKRAGVKCSDLSAIAVTYGPGLAPALEVGVRTAKQLAQEHSLPLIAVNHMEGHTLSGLLRNRHGKPYSGLDKALFPCLAVVVSGKHSDLVWIENIGHYRLLGQTLDDAPGEAFDKIGRMLDLGYPAGPVISQLAQGHNRAAFDLPRPMQHSDNYHFSFSGLKTSCLYQTNRLKDELGAEFAAVIPDYCASVEEAIVESLLGKTLRAAKEHQPNMVLFGGGVSANKRLRFRFRRELAALDIPAYFAPKQFCTDNGAMIALAGYYKLQRGETVADIAALDRDPSISIEDANKKSASF